MVACHVTKKSSYICLDHMAKTKTMQFEYNFLMYR